jgi:hypothetical protein
MATNTYVALDKSTIVGSSTSSITFSSISQAYTDLVIVVNATLGTSVGLYGLSINLNGDSTASNYSYTRLQGNGTSATSNRATSDTGIGFVAETASMDIINIMNYSNATTYKTTLSRANSMLSSDGRTAAYISLWRNTAAVTSITLFSAVNFVAGSTFSLYGIKAEVGGTSTKATGGTVTSDATYYYHTFLTSGNFVPNQSITADYLVIGGGGSGGGGGGAGAYRTSLPSSPLSLTATSYAVLVGGGAAPSGILGNGSGANGNDTIFSSITSNGGGHAGEIGTQTSPNKNGVANGNASGGGSGTGTNATGGAAGTYGNKGGDGSASYPYPPAYGSGGGGGAGGAGGNGTSSKGGDGGAGLNTNSAWATVTGTGVSGYYAGGGAGYAEPGYAQLASAGSGGGGNATTAPDGTANTGSGGGAIGSLNPVAYRGGAGGSGIVIVRYAK